MSCNCEGFEKYGFGSPEIYSQQVTLDTPDFGENWNRNDGFCIDPCIAEEIKHLWSLGVQTTGCCCGHNMADSYVGVKDKHIEQMLSLGYIQNHEDKSRKDTFRTKTGTQHLRNY